MTARTVLDAMPNPDDVGESEYRALWEHLDSVIASAEPACAPDGTIAADEVLQIVVASVDTLIEAARVARRAFLQEIVKSTLGRDALRLDAELDRILGLTEMNQKMTRSIELHGRLSKLTDEINAMDEGPEREQARVILHATIHRLLTDVFGLDDKAIQEGVAKL